SDSVSLYLHDALPISVRGNVGVVVVAGLHAVLHHGEVVGEQLATADAVIILDASPQVSRDGLIRKFLKDGIGLDHVYLSDVPGRDRKSTRLNYSHVSR